MSLIRQFVRSHRTSFPFMAVLVLATLGLSSLQFRDLPNSEPSAREPASDKLSFEKPSHNHGLQKPSQLLELEIKVLFSQREDDGFYRMRLSGRVQVLRDLETPLNVEWKLPKEAKVLSGQSLTVIQPGQLSEDATYELELSHVDPSSVIQFLALFQSSGPDSAAKYGNVESLNLAAVLSNENNGDSNLSNKALRDAPPTDDQVRAQKNIHL